MADATCSVPGCDRPTVGRGLCRPHYTWSYRHGWATPSHDVRTEARSAEQRRASSRAWKKANPERVRDYMRQWHEAHATGRPTGRPSTHGMTGTREFRSWEQAKARVTNPNHHAWSLYGGRGIRMYEGWLNDFSAFYAYMGPRPAGTSLDRIDPDGDYAPGNVRWADAKTQGANRRNVKGR